MQILLRKKHLSVYIRIHPWLFFDEKFLFRQPPQRELQNYRNLLTLCRMISKRIRMPVKIRGKFLFIPLFLTMLGFSYAVFMPEVGVEADKSRIAFRKGLDLYSEYKYSSSVDFFLESLSYEPDFALARRMLGQSLYFSGQVDEALNEWKILQEQENYDPSLQIHLQGLRSFQVIAEPKWQYLKTLKGVQGYQYAYPTFISMLPNDSLVLLSQGRKDGGNVLLVSSNGVFTENLRRISGKIQLPIGAAFDGKILWITDIKADKLHRLSIERRAFGDPAYKNLEPMGKPGSGSGEFHGPTGICFNGENFFVADQGNERVQKLDKEGGYVQEIKWISENVQINQPFGIACDLKNVYVSEPDLSRILQFDVFGNFIQYIGDGLFQKPRHLSLSGKYLVVADEQAGVLLLDLEKNENIRISEYMGENGVMQKFYRPYSAQMDGLGNLFVVDYAGQSLIQFVPEQFLYSNLELWVEKVYSKGFPEVGVWVSVKDQRGKFLTNLDSTNFTILENDADVGTPGSEYLKNYSGQVSWVIINSKTATMKKYINSMIWVSDFFLSKLKEKDAVKVLGYSGDSRTDTEWTNSRLKLLQSLKVQSSTDYQTDNVSGLGKAVYSAISDLLPVKGKRAVIWITEGNIEPEKMPDFSMSRLESFARNNHIPVFIINFENPDIIDWKNKKSYLKEFSEKTGGKYFASFDSSLKDIEKTMRSIVEERYVLTYQSNGRKSWKGQYMEIKVNVKFQGRTGMETSGYFIH